MATRRTSVQEMVGADKIVIGGITGSIKGGGGGVVEGSFVRCILDEVLRRKS